jgi:carbon monoxide dehydrogenase subunit G
MKLEQSFEVDAPLETVWAALVDVQRVAPCLPGAELTDASEDGTYRGTFSVKIGPAKASYNGTMTMAEVDAAAHRVTMNASGTDKRGQGGAKAIMHSTLTERAGGGTHVAVETDLTITGRLASFSRGGMIQDVSNRLLGEFASCLQETLASEPAPAPSAPPAPASPGPPSGPAPGATEAGSAAPAPPPAARPAASPRPAAKPINGLTLVLRVVWDRLRRLAGRAPRSGR